jgi:glycosyltransferase involved in cell wall biosynthesis
LAGEDDRVRGIRLSRNYGQHSALLCGIRAAKHEIVLTMDDDLQHPVSEIATMLAALTPEFDVVYGAPLEEQHGFLRDLASRLTKMALTSAMGAETARNVSAFRAFRTRLREGFQDYRSPWVSIDVLLTWATSRFAAIKVRHAQRAAGISGYTPRKLIRHALNLMTGFSTLPLQIASFVGFGFVLFGFSDPGFRADQLSDPRRRRAGFCLPGLDRRHFLGSPAFRSRHLWRVSRPHVLPQHGSSGLCYWRRVWPPGADPKLGDFTDRGLD